MPEIHLVLSFILGNLFLLAVGGLALSSMAHAKNRIIREQRRALEAEQRLRRAQEAFSDNAHHELKTPLQIISGNLHLLRLLGPDPEQEKVLARAEEATGRLHNLVHDLLEFTALQHGSLVIRPDLLDLGAHLRALVADHEAAARTKGLEFHADLELPPLPVLCDWPRMRRVFAALLDNAVRFTAEGSVRVRLQTRREDGQCLLTFDVADTGRGLPEDWVNLLEPFEQGTLRPHLIPEGLGIGLPLAAGILAAMGGRMGLQPLANGTQAWVEVALPDAAGG